MKVLLDDDVAPTGECRIFVVNEYGIGSRAACGIFGAVHKAKDITFVEVSKTVHFIGGADRLVQPSHDLRSEFKTQIHPLGANVKDQVTWCRNSMARTRT